MREQAARQNNDAWQAIDAEIKLHPAPNDSDAKTLAGLIVGEWQSPRHDTLYRADGTWTLLPAEAGILHGTWHVEGNQYFDTAQYTDTTATEITSVTDTSETTDSSMCFTNCSDALSFGSMGCPFPPPLVMLQACAQQSCAPSCPQFIEGNPPDPGCTPCLETSCAAELMFCQDN